MIITEVKHLIRKEIVLEWRNRHTLNGILLYLASTIFICYLSIRARQQSLQPETWNTLFWIIILFSAINAVTKSFIQIGYGRLLYYYTIASPEAVILSKTIYNSILLIVIGLTGAFFYSVVLGNPVVNNAMFILAIITGSWGLASVLTIVSGIASKASNSTTLMAILSFPILLPQILLIIKVTGYAIEGLEWSAVWDKIAVLTCLNIIAVTMSYILFPYLWKN
jgi:heme exporter protein B